MLTKKTPENAQQYKKYRNKLTHIKELAKKSYYEELGKNSHDSGLLWKRINDNVKFKHKLSSSPTQILMTNGITNSLAEISKAFNDRVTSIANSPAADIPNASNQNDCYPSSSIFCALQSFFLKPVTVEQIAYHLLGLDCFKSTGIKGIPIKFINLAGSFLIPILSKLFSASIKQGSFPTVFKTAEVVGVFKSGSKQSLSNYRPISLLCPFSKLLENVFVINCINTSKTIISFVSINLALEKICQQKLPYTKFIQISLLG